MSNKGILGMWNDFSSKTRKKKRVVQKKKHMSRDIFTPIDERSGKSDAYKSYLRRMGI